MFEIIYDLKAKWDQHRPLSAAIVKNLHEDLVLRWTYHSNAIEGNTLTLLETKVVLEGITVGGKALREHFEAINHRDAILYVEDIIKNKNPFQNRKFGISINWFWKILTMKMLGDIASKMS